MARLTNKERDEKKAQGKKLFIKGLSIQSISEIIKISTTSLKSWRVKHKWDEARKSNNISIRELQNEILETYQSLKNGEKPKLTADQISKLAAAFDKISDPKKQLAYMFEAYEQLSDALEHNLINNSTENKEFRLKAYKYTRAVMDEITNQLSIEIAL